MALLAHRRIEKFGLEVPLDVTYPKWEPGGEYTKLIVLKNVKIKTQKIKFKVSSNAFFSAIYPQPIVLSAGNTYALPITFRPTEKSDYEDCVEFETSDGIFSVPLYALVPQPNLILPETIQFGLCAVKDTLTLEITVTNTGLVPTEFHWECTAPFEIIPTIATMDPKESCKLKVSFSPSIATVYQVTAICHYGENYHISKIMKLQGTSKYPHLQVRHTKLKSPIKSRPLTRKTKAAQTDINGAVTVQFGDVPIGTVSEATIEFINTTPVPASFTLQPELKGKLKDMIFTFSQTEGIVPPLGTVLSKVYYSPTYTEQTSTSYYRLSTIGGLASTRILCTGTPLGPCVSLEESCLNFGSIECGQTSSAVVHIRNTSSAHSVYQFLLDPANVFHTDSPCGEIAANSTCAVTMHFSPLKPHPYHRLVTCLVLNQEPLTIHAIGSAFTENVKPVILNPHHISLYKSAAYSGLSKLPPEYLEQCIENGSLTVSDEGFLLQTEVSDPSLRQLSPQVELNNQSSMYARYFQPENEPFESYHVSIDQEYLDFDYTAFRKSSEKKVIALTNHTEGSIYCQWMTDRGEVFQILPIEREIPPNSTAAFTASFWPDKPNQLFSKQLECYICYKSLRDYTVVDNQVVILPWCLTVTAMGHSFSPNSEPFLPALSFNTCNIVFPSSVEKQTVYRSIVGRNCGDTPVMFRFVPEPSSVFSIKPERGVIAGTYQLFALSMSPKTPLLYESILTCTMNNCSDYKQELLLSGLAEVPKIQVNKGELYFKPTCVGDCSEVQVTVTNPCGLPIQFHWQFRGPDAEVVKAIPHIETLLPQGMCYVTFKFSPQEIKNYSIKAVATTSFKDHSIEKSSHRYKNAITLYGKGTTGSIKCTTNHLDCSYITIGTSLQQSLTLENDSQCSLKFILGVSQVIELEDGTKEQVAIGQKLHGLELNEVMCELESHSKQTISLCLRPSQPALMESTLYYQLVLSQSTATAEWQPLCSIRSQAVYPSLSVIDVQADGLIGSMSKSQIWKMLNVDRLNSYLNQYPSPDELRYAITTRHSITRTVPTLTRAVLDFDFGTAPLDADKESTFFLLLANSSNVPVFWAFQFPADMYLEPEYWAETGQIDAVEQHHLDVINNGLYSVQPKQGHLGVGKRAIVKCSYRHSHLGTSRLPVLLKISRGREVMLNFTGSTSPLQTPSVASLSPVHVFAPVPINVQSYPVQFFELTNFGDTPGAYVIDTTPLDDITKNNYDNCVLQCLKPEGSLAPRQTTSIPFVFSPTEAKLYSIDLSIYFSTGDMMVMTYQGEGITNDADTVPDLEHVSQNIPERSDLTLPDQLVGQSQDRLNLGSVPLFAVVRRLVFLKNMSQFSVSYHWQLSGHLAEEVVSIHPVSGYLQPDQTTSCRVTFHALTCPAVYDIDIFCQIINESDKAVYMKKMEKWERENDQRKHHFEIVDPQAITNPKAMGKTTGKTYEQWKKHDLSVKSKSRTRQKEVHLAKLPVPPTPQHMHLGITARTHAISDYCQQFDDFESYTIDQQSLKFNSTPSANERGLVPVKQEENSTLDAILGQMLRELLTDSNFQNSLHCLVEEPIPYFAQFSSNYRPISLESDDDKEADHATRHVYASGLEGLPSAVESAEQESYVPIGDDVNVGSELSIGLPELPPPLAALNSEDKIGFKIKNSSEFQTMVEKTVENIILNIICESLAGELDLTAPIYVIAKPP